MQREITLITQQNWYMYVKWTKLSPLFMYLLIMCGVHYSPHRIYTYGISTGGL